MPDNPYESPQSTSMAATDAKAVVAKSSFSLAHLLASFMVATALTAMVVKRVLTNGVDATVLLQMAFVAIAWLAWILHCFGRINSAGRRAP